MTLISNLVSRIGLIWVCISPIFFEVGIAKIGVLMHLGVMECHIPFWGYCDLEL